MGNFRNIQYSTEVKVDFRTEVIEYETTIKFTADSPELVRDLSNVDPGDLQEILKIWFESPEWTKIK